MLLSVAEMPVRTFTLIHRIDIQAVSLSSDVFVMYKEQIVSRILGVGCRAVRIHGDQSL